MHPLRSLVTCGTKLWLDSIDPDLIKENLEWDTTGATSNPIIVADLIKTSRFQAEIDRLLDQGLDATSIAWQITDRLVRGAQDQFLPVWERTAGNDGYVSFEVDPLLEDAGNTLSHAERVARYIGLGTQWAAGHRNRMIKVPATPAGLDALAPLVAAGVTLNVTLIFSMDQYQQARDNIWRGAQARKSLKSFKSVYSIFVSRVDIYTEKHLPQLSPAAQGQVGIVNAKRIWRANQEFWSTKQLPLQQEIIFASTGTKRPEDPPTKYVQAFAGSDIQTNPPATNVAASQSGIIFQRQVDGMPAPEVLAEIDAKVDWKQMEQTLMEEGLKKFADPQKTLIQLLADQIARR
ncbi:MAG: transaldolase [Planctomycetes bacterium]|nr:transaldolase [Planctomycetota bacterium]